MPTPTDKHHAAPAPTPPPAPAPIAAPAASPAGPDINIPPPNGNVPGRTVSTQPPPVPPGPAPYDLRLGMSSTELVIAMLLLAVWAGLLIFAKRLLTQSLVAQFADLGRSRAAGTTLYLFLLALGATVIFCALGDFWTVFTVVIPASILVVVLLVLFLVSLTTARASRQRR